MSKLRAPIRELLDDRLPEPDVQRMWRALQRRTSRRVPRPSAMPLLAAACMVLIALAGWLALRGTDAAGALAIVGADALGPSRVLDGDVARVWPLTDGSRIQLSGSSRLEVLENTGRAFAMRLESGRGAFEVKPGGPRRWRIECGELSVEVVGTSFVVDRDARGVSVDVRHGVVKVRSARIPGGLRRLAAGEHVYVPEGQPVDARHVELPARQAGVPARQQPPTVPALEPAGDSSLAQHSSAAESPATSRAPRASAGVDEPASLLRAADRARRNGDAARAEALFERVRGRWPGTPHAALASLTLARMRMDASPERAAQDLTAALAADLPDGLREDAMARLVEANARAGKIAPAERAAEAYQRAFPNGRRAAEIERWVQQP
jgi:transmembrane sensor